MNKLLQLVKDPVLRRWLIGRILGIYEGEPPFTPHVPPYLTTYRGSEEHIELLLKGADAAQDKTEGEKEFEIRLPGTNVVLKEGKEKEFFRRQCDDIETYLAIHRFSWIPIQWSELQESWVIKLWQLWCERYGDSQDYWPWHPYTAAERAINLIQYFRKFGVPDYEDITLQVLNRHVHEIIRQLEYFGDHHTSNHLSNNGRGLYFLGYYLNSKHVRTMGRDILLHEANRLFGESGMLREGSSHYHFLLTRNYISTWLLAERYGLPEKDRLKGVAAQAMSVLSLLTLPGGLPLIGDISPDCPPDFLTCLLEGFEGWCGILDEKELADFLSLRESIIPTSAESFQRDGWYRFELGKWSGLWHVSPEGWSPMPGHGHQDCGSFELHYADTPIFVDPGRGSYGENGVAADYRSAFRHNTLLVDHAEPYPPNKPYYGKSFREQVCGGPPTVKRDSAGIYLSHNGFSRLRGVGALERIWQFSQSEFTLTDRLAGKGQRSMERYLYTPLQVDEQQDGLRLWDYNRAFKLTITSGNVTVDQATRWYAYARGEPINVIRLSNCEHLPWQSEIKINLQ